METTPDPFDPRPLLERPEHWRYGKCGWQTQYRWEERVAMSELGIGPEQAPLNKNRRVGSIYLGSRTGDQNLQWLASFEQLQMAYLVGSSITNAGLAYLAAHPTLTWVWVGDTPVTEAGLRTLERLRPEMFVMRSGEGAISNGKGGWTKIGRTIHRSARRIP